MIRRAGQVGVAVGALAAVLLCGCSSAPTTAVPPAAGSATTGPASSGGGAGSTAVSAPSARPLYDAACAGRLANHPLGMVKPDDITEVSGVVVSRTDPDVLWVHNDSGGLPEAYALSPHGDLLLTLPLPGATNIDWEDIALGPGPTAGHDDLYLGDIGDNAVARPNITVYRIAEPRLGDSTTTSSPAPAKFDTFTLTYPDGPHNAETLMIDPITRDLIIVTKESEGPSVVFTAPAASLNDGATLTLDRAGTLERGSSAASGPLSLVTGGDVSRDGSVVAIRTYGAVLLYAREPGQSVPQALTTAPCDANAALETQGEAVGFAPDGRSFFTIPEGQNAPIDQNTITS